MRRRSEPPGLQILRRMKSDDEQRSSEERGVARDEEEAFEIRKASVRKRLLN